ncbi:MAG: ABC-F family ATP-binding cassette domain-containing protein [Pseudolabrys sp.]
MLTIDDLTVRVAGRLLLERSSAQVPPGARVGLIGRNGSGKTTLFGVIAGDHPSEQGHVTIPPRWRLGRLAQEAPGGPDKLIDIVLRADPERTALLGEAETATDPHRIADIQTRLADIGAYAAPARAASILSGLGFSAADQQRPCSEFSGGWRMRVALAAVLFAQPDLLLLDEPTNYLDLEGTLWLQDHLARYPHSLIVISHDRDLLDTSVDHILALENRRLTLYRGGYTAFEKARNERIALDQKLVKKQDARRKHLQAFVDRFRAKATKARQAQSRLKMLAKLQPIAVDIVDDARPIDIPSPDKLLSPPIVAIDGVAAGYEPGNPVLRGLTLRVDDDDRIALIGANGNGKSTLVKVIADRLAPMAGTVIRADKIRIAYFAQHQLDELEPTGTPYTHLRKLMPDATEASVRARAGAIGFSGATADTEVARLSGGEKARLLLGLATFHGPHLLILDEPTNHLDIDSRAALIEAINEFAGAVILVSHDRHLLDACADRLWLVANGTVRAFDGDLDDYRRQILVERSQDDGKTGKEKSTTGPDRAELRRAAAAKRAETAPLRQRVTAVETRMKALTQAIATIDATLADGSLFAGDPAKAGALSKQRADHVAALTAAEEEWIAASEAYEAANT